MRTSSPAFHRHRVGGERSAANRVAVTSR